jgi:hypothetical protein
MLKQPKDYWNHVLFQEEDKEPSTVAAVRKMKKPYASFFSQLRKAVLGLKGVEENIRYMGPTWKWTWTYEYNREKLLFLHPMQNGLSATFIVAYGEESKILNAPGISPDIKTAIRLGRKARNVRWVWLELNNEDRVNDLIETIRYKYELLTTAPEQAEEQEEEVVAAVDNQTSSVAMAVKSETISGNMANRETGKNAGQ